MLSNVFKALLFCSVFHFIGASVTGPKDDFAKIKSSRVVVRRVGQFVGNHDGSIVRRQDWGGSSASATASASATVNAQVMLQQWSTLAAAADKCQTVFQQGASLEVAFRAAAEFSAQAAAVNRQAGRCACDPSATDVAAQYKASIVHMFSSLQVVLQLGAQHYGSVWASRFKPIFQSCSPAFASMKQISVDLQIDLAAALQQAHLDVSLFLNVGLNLGALLGINLRIGGLLSL